MTEKVRTCRFPEDICAIHLVIVQALCEGIGIMWICLYDVIAVELGA